MMMQSVLDPFFAFLSSLRASVLLVLPPGLVGALPALILVAFAFVVLVVGLKFNPLPLSILAVLLSSVAALLSDHTTYPLQCFGVLYIRDAFSDFFIMIVLVVAFLILVASSTYKGDTGAYNFLLLISFAGALLVVMANDLASIFVAWELMSTPTYVLVALGRNRGAVDGAMKYFVMGLLSTALMLLGITLVYTATGLTELPAVAAKVTDIWLDPFDTRVYALLIAIVLFVISFGFKIGVFPGWMWVADAYGTADGSVAGYLAGGTKKTGVGALVRILLIFPVVAQLSLISSVLAVVSLLTMVTGNFLALAQRNIMRMLAYSSIAMMGYLFMGLAASTPEGIAAALYTAFAHAMMKTPAFILVWALTIRLSKQITYEELAGLSHRSPFAAGALSVMVLSLAGLPFTVGFISKIVLFWSAYSAGLLWLVIAAVLNTVYSLGYYLRVVRSCYFREPSESSIITLPRTTTVAVGLAVAAIFVFGIAFGLVLDWATVAADHMLP